MTDEIFISEPKALALLIGADYSERQARIILGHSRKQTMCGETYYPATYIALRASGLPWRTGRTE